MRTFRIGTRGSALALWQANTVARALQQSAGIAGELVVIRTSGDERPSTPPDAPESLSVKATFVKEIEDALLGGQVDLAVHSSKDLSAMFPPGLVIGATLPREDPRDALLLPHGERVSSLDALRARLGPRPRFGTSSARRVAQLTRLFPDASFTPLRGNVDTRLRKLDKGECDAAMLACAGLKRLQLGERISFAPAIDLCVPAPGQGIVTVQVREDQRDIASMVAQINDDDTFAALAGERAVVHTLGGGCQMPLGVHARIAGERVAIIGVVISPDGAQMARADRSGARADAAAVGIDLAESLIKQGAAAIMRLA